LAVVFQAHNLGSALELYTSEENIIEDKLVAFLYAHKDFNHKNRLSLNFAQFVANKLGEIVGMGSYLNN